MRRLGAVAPRMHSAFKVYHNKYIATGADPLDRPLRKKMFHCTIDLMLMENLGFFSADGQATTFSNFLVSRVPQDLFVDFVVLMEMLKAGQITYEQHQMDLPPDFTPNITPSKKMIEYEQEILLLTRVFSIRTLRRAQIHKDTRDIDFDLSLFSSTVNQARRNVRLLAESCAGNILLRHPDLMCDEKDLRAQAGKEPIPAHAENSQVARLREQAQLGISPSDYFAPTMGKYRRLSVYANNLGGVFMKSILVASTKCRYTLADPSQEREAMKTEPHETALHQYLPHRFVDWVDASWLVQQLQYQGAATSPEDIATKAKELERYTLSFFAKIIADIYDMVKFWCLFKDLIDISGDDASGLKDITECAHKFLCSKLRDMGFLQSAQFQKLNDLFKQSLGMKTSHP